MRCKKGKASNLANKKVRDKYVKPVLKKQEKIWASTMDSTSYYDYYNLVACYSEQAGKNCA
ncbi:MAG: hypothetical protein QMD71_09300 [bacterium]|nr:hypothetical protein [bacterium]